MPTLVGVNIALTRRIIVPPGSPWARAFSDKCVGPFARLGLLRSQHAHAMAKKRSRGALEPYAQVRTAAERYAAGQALRAKVPRSAHAEWAPAKHRPDAITMVMAASRTSVPELVPIRYGRMSTSPFAFYRGAADIMAYDLSHTPVCGVHAQLCGDAHLSNYGLF